MKNINLNLIKKIFGAILVVVAIMSITYATSNTTSEVAQKPNVLIILVDDLGYGDISSFGQVNYKTPHIDKIGTEGVSSTDFYVPTPYCAPSRATLLTGRFPLRHGLTKNPTPDANDFIDNVGLSPDEGHETHDLAFAKRIDRRVCDLCEKLPEIIE